MYTLMLPMPRQRKGLLGSFPSINLKNLQTKYPAQMGRCSIIPYPEFFLTFNLKNMNGLKENPSSRGCLPQFLITILGLIFPFLIFFFLFIGDHRAAVIAETIIVACGFITGFLLSFYLDKSWYFWSLSLSLPMTGMCFLFVLGLIGGKQVSAEILILATSGFFTLISSSLGGYLGKMRKRKSGNADSITINLPSTDKALQCKFITKQGQVDIYITHYEQLPTYIQLLDLNGQVLSTEQTQTVNGTMMVSVNTTIILSSLCIIRVFNSDGISVEEISVM